MTLSLGDVDWSAFVLAGGLVNSGSWVTPLAFGLSSETVDGDNGGDEFDEVGDDVTAVLDWGMLMFLKEIKIS